MDGIVADGADRPAEMRDDSAVSAPDGLEQDGEVGAASAQESATEAKDVSAGESFDTDGDAGVDATGADDGVILSNAEDEGAESELPVRSAAVQTLEAARALVERAGLMPFAPHVALSAAPAPSFVEATLGHASATPSYEESAPARSLLARLIAEGSAVPLNLLGAPGTSGEAPDFVVSTAAFPYIFTLRGDKGWKQLPETSGASKVSPLAVNTYSMLVENGPQTAYALTGELGKGLTEAAVLRALSELWQQLRVIPVPQANGKPTVWEPITSRLLRQVKAGANAGQPTALSALISLYLGQVLLATEDEIEVFLSTVAPRSRVRDVVHALMAAQQLESMAIAGKQNVYLPGELPEFSSPAAAAAVRPVAQDGPTLADDGSRIRRMVKSTRPPGDRAKPFRSDRAGGPARPVRAGQSDRPGRSARFGGGAERPSRVGRPEGSGREARPDRGSRPPRGDGQSFHAGAASRNGAERGPRADRPQGSGRPPRFDRPWEENRRAPGGPGLDAGAAREGGDRGADRPRPPVREGFQGGDRPRRTGGDRPALGRGREASGDRRDGQRPSFSRASAGDRADGPRGGGFAKRPSVAGAGRGGEGGAERGFSRPREDRGAGAGGGGDRERRPFRRDAVGDRSQGRGEGEAGAAKRDGRPPFRRFDAPRDGDRPFRPARQADGGAERPRRTGAGPRPGAGSRGGDRPAGGRSFRSASDDGRPREGAARPFRPAGGARFGSSVGRPGAGTGRSETGAGQDRKGPQRPFAKRVGDSASRGARPAARGGERGGGSPVGGPFDKFKDGNKPWGKRPPARKLKPEGQES